MEKTEKDVQRKRQVVMGNQGKGLGDQGETTCQKGGAEENQAGKGSTRVIGGGERETTAIKQGIKFVVQKRTSRKGKGVRTQIPGTPLMQGQRIWGTGGGGHTGAG